jgi:CubicO group peptidase (beta-lactamase class C family)
MNVAHTLDRIGAVADRVIATGATPGVAVALTDRERLLGIVTRGHADPASGTAVTPDTLFEIGSISKSFTAICLLRQVEAGRLSLDDPVGRHLPWFPLPDRTVRELLTHTAGIIKGIDDLPASPASILRLAHTPAVETGRYWYSNVGYQALGYLLEALTGETYAKTYARTILEPLDMRASSPVITNELRPSLAVGYLPLHDERPWRAGDPAAPAPWVEYGMGDGSVCATAGDLAAYLRMLLNRGGNVLPSQSFDELVHPAVEDDEGGHYGLGLQTKEIAARTWIGHDGSMVGYQSAMWGDPQAGLGALALVNGTHPVLIAEYALRLLLDPDTQEPKVDQLADSAAALQPDPEPAGVWRERAGTYRSYSPWMPALVICTVGGEPHVVIAGAAEPLVDLGDGLYRAGREPHIPERLTFGPPLGGRTYQCWYSTAPYVRPFNG